MQPVWILFCRIGKMVTKSIIKILIGTVLIIILDLALKTGAVIENL